METYVHILIILHLFGITAAVSSFPLLMVVSLDGFWSGYLSQYKDVTPNLHEIADSGVVSPWMEATFMTKTLPNHQTIVTGLYEESHGIIANSFYDPVLNEIFTSNSTAAEWWDTGPIPIWVLNQLADPGRISGGMMWPGVQAAIKNQTAFYSVPYYDIVNQTLLIDKIISWLTNDTNPANLVLFYIPEPDLTGHKYGPNSEEIKEAVYKVDKTIGYLKEQLKIVRLYSKINLIIVSDHGMAEVTSDKIITLEKILDHSYFNCHWQSPVLAIYPAANQEEFVYRTFQNASIQYNNSFKIYKKEDIPMQFHYKDNRRIPPFLLVAEEGYDVLFSVDAKNKTNRYGNHGYNNSATSMHALFIAHGPAFKSGVVVPPVRNIDLYPLMCYLLRLIPEKNNGTLSNTLIMLSNPFGLHITNKWLIVVCSILGICILIAAVSVFFANKKEEYDERNDGLAAKMFKLGPNSSGEENTYLLVTSSADEV